MTDRKIIRLATKSDSAALLNIYAAYIRDTAISFETEIPSVFAFGERIETIQQQFPWLVCEIDGRVVGYAYASKHKERTAYQWSADLSVYVDPRAHRKHIATSLYTALLECLRLQGYYSAFAAITVPNASSEALHCTLGFQPIGVFERVGYKLGKWRDVQYFKRVLADYPTEPRPPVSICMVKDTEEYQNSIQRAEAMLR